MLTVVSTKNEHWDDETWQVLGIINAESEEHLMEELKRVLGDMYKTDEGPAEVDVKGGFMFLQRPYRRHDEQKDRFSESIREMERRWIWPEETRCEVIKKINFIDTERITLDLKFNYTKFI